MKFKFPGHEKGKVKNGLPEGWERRKVKEVIATVSKKKKIPKELYEEEGIIPCVDQSQVFIGGYTNDLDAKISNPLPLIVFGDHTRVLKFINFEFASGADGTQLIIPDYSSNLSVEYLYIALCSIDLSNYFYSRHLKFLKEEVIIKPSTFCVESFTEIISPIFNQIKTLTHQTQKLQEARNILLPKLMSGKIAV